MTGIAEKGVMQSCTKEDSYSRAKAESFATSKAMLPEASTRYARFRKIALCVLESVHALSEKQPS
jgi:hypothetical protein